MLKIFNNHFTLQLNSLSFAEVNLSCIGAKGDDDDDDEKEDEVVDVLIFFMSKNKKISYTNLYL